MSQKLIMPFERAMMLCGYKNANYKEAWGYPHYGVDISSIQGGAGSNHNIYGSGIGEVVAVGKDNTLGYGVAVLYKDCEDRYGNTKCDIIARYMHMKSILVAKGDAVTTDTIIGAEGKEGTEDYHLHLEFDTDTNYPVYSPQVSRGHTFWKKGTDTTLNPSLWLYQDEERILVTPTYNPAWLNAEDKNTPQLVTLAEGTPIAYDEDKDEDYYGEPAYYIYNKEVDGYKLFDKWWRKISSDTYPTAGTYATEAEKKKAKAWNDDIPEKYKAANDAEGKAGLESIAEGENGDEEIERLRAAITKYEAEKASVANKLREIIEMLEA